MADTTLSPRIFAGSMPTEALRNANGHTTDAIPGSDDLAHLDDRTSTRSQRKRPEPKAKPAQPWDHLKPDERKLVEEALDKGVWRGVIGQHRMHEIIADLHAQSPWMAPATTVVMKAMARATSDGAAPFTMPPLLLVGGPGIGKSQWARALAEAFDVPQISVDIGATGGGIFALSGVERGWGSATPGRLVREMLTTHVVNPLVILDEVDKIPEQVTTSKGMGMPSTYDVLKSLIEPGTARNWTCPYFQLPFDMSRINWVMTTNGIDTMPQAFLDRCTVVHLADPTPQQLIGAAHRMVAVRFAADDRDIIGDVIAAHLRTRAGERTSLRHLKRMIDRIEDGWNKPFLS